MDDGSYALVGNEGNPRTLYPDTTMTMLLVVTVFMEIGKGKVMHHLLKIMDHSNQ
ncbi:hypothetical protein HanPSC8_Chr17g0779311 [Helianthus annuus]|nr:hypothetical protein HanPSC8_Chr17g0779311 [Helianthus annuus]